MSSSQSSSGQSSSRRRLVILALAAAAVVAAVLLLPVREWLQQAVDWIEGLGPWGPAALVGLYVVSCVAGVPGSVLTLGAGAVFGVAVGTVAVFVGATLGACAAFLVGRYLARDWVAGRVADSPRFAAIDRAVGSQGFRVVALTRLSPVFPFNLLNYAYGLTSVSFRDYLLGSVGMLPGTLMYVYLGSAAGQAVDETQGTASVAQQALFWGGLLATVAVTVLVTRVARAALGEQVDDLPDEPS